jgi:uncharacterized membrane protein HdeD (DUF308 family)
MKTAALMLVTLGIAALVYGGFTFDRENTVMDMEPSRSVATQHHAPELSPIVGVIAIMGGLLLLIAPGRRFA